MVYQRWQRWLLLSAAASISVSVTQGVRVRVSASPLGLVGMNVPATPTPANIILIHAIAAIDSLDLRLVASYPYSVQNLLSPSRAAAISAASGFTPNYNIPRGGGGGAGLPQSRVSEQDNPMEDNHHSKAGTIGGYIDDIVTLPLPKRLLTVAKDFVGRTKNLLFFGSRRQEEQGIHHSQQDTEDNVNVDHSFDELDSIIKSNTSMEVKQQHEHLRENASINVDSNNNLPSWPKLPRGVSSMTGGWKERTFRHWINQVCSNICIATLGQTHPSSRYCSHALISNISSMFRWNANSYRERPPMRLRPYAI
jgi:hypothetical protein